MTVPRATTRYRRRFRANLGTTPVFTADISAGGFCVDVLRTPMPGSPVIGTIRIDGAEVHYAGRVVWARAGSPRLNLHGRIGIRFTSLPMSAAKLLASCSPPVAT
jgi:PilZ domain